MKICKHDAGHMTKMVAMPIYGKNSSKNLRLRNQEADFHERATIAHLRISILNSSQVSKRFFFNWSRAANSAVHGWTKF